MNDESSAYCIHDIESRLKCQSQINSRILLRAHSLSFSLSLTRHFTEKLLNYIEWAGEVFAAQNVNDNSSLDEMAGIRTTNVEQDMNYQVRQVDIAWIGWHEPKAAFNFIY